MENQLENQQFPDQQQAPSLDVNILSRAQAAQQQLQHLFKNVSQSQFPTVEVTLSTYGLKAYYCLSPHETARIPHEASSFDVYVSRFADIRALKEHLKQNGFYRSEPRQVVFIGVFLDEYEEDGDDTE